MQHRKLNLALAGIVLAAASFAASADILFQNIGNVAPPAQLGSHTMTPFDEAPQAAITEMSAVSSIPGGPGGTSVGVSPAALKATDGISWNAPTSWPGGASVFFYSNNSDTLTLTLPAGSKAFYFYVESNYYTQSFSYTATTDSGATSTPVVVAGNGGGHGFAFYSTAGEDIATITVSSAGLSGGFVVGQFGIATGPTTTCASEGYTGTKLEWCKNICERGYTGSTLAMWIRRWTDRYRTLPYCAIEPQPQPE